MLLSNLPTDMQTVSLADSVPTPWKNQRGTTRELLTWPTTENWRLRLSVATIDQSGEFSEFENITRWFTVIDGQGVDLLLGQSKVSLDTSTDPFCFDGGLPCVAKLKGGTAYALNAMFATDFEGRALRLRSGESIELGLAEFVGIYAIESAQCEIAREQTSSVSKVSLEASSLRWTAGQGKLLGNVPSHLKVHDGHVVVVLGGVLDI